MVSFNSVVILHYFKFLAEVSDAGKYMVRATNAGGEAISIADVIVQGGPPEPAVFISPPPAQVGVFVLRFSCTNYFLSQ